MADTKILIEVGAKNTTQRTFDQVQKSMKQTQVQAGAANRSFRQMRGMMGQMGHQVQDVAVQMQMGTNGLIILGQQGGQIAALFGPHGAVLGAFIAIGAALGTSLAPALFKTKDSMKDLEEASRNLSLVFELTDGKVTDLSASFKDLMKQSEALASFHMETSLLQAAKAVDLAFEALAETVDKKVGKAFDDFGDSNLKETIANIKDTGVSLEDATAVFEENGVTAYQWSQTAYDAVTRVSGSLGIYRDEAETVISAMSELDSNTPVETLTAFAGAISAIPNRSDNIKDLKAQLQEVFAIAIEAQNKLAGAEKTQVGLDGLTPAERKAQLNARIDSLAEEESLVMAGFDKAAENAAAAAQVEKDRQKAARDGRINAMAEEEALVANGMADAEANRKAAEQAKYDARQAELEEMYRLEQEYIQAGFDAQMKANLKKIEDERKVTAERKEIQADYNEAVKQMNIETINNAASFMGQLANGLEEGSSAYKAAFLVQKGLNIASIIMNAQSAAAAAIAPPPMGFGPVIGQGMVAKIHAQAAMGVGMIAGQTLASFEGGGITFDGIRAGGVDGKGGRMAVVHPNEKITDLEKEGSSQPVSVNINLSAIDTQTGAEFLMKNRAIITNAVTKAMNNKARRGLM